MDNNLNTKQNTVLRKETEFKALMIIIILISIAACITSVPIGKSIQYQTAVKAFEAKKYTSAYKAFDELGNYKDSADKKKACVYEQAQNYVKNQKYIKAYKKFMTISDYSDTKEQMSAIYNNYKKEEISLLKAAKKGDVVTLGEYENKQIEWIVLSTNKEKGKALLISKHSLVKKPFNEETDITWNDSSIRKWLNDSFYKSAFANAEKSMIIKSELKNKKNPDYKTSSGKKTKDKIFLLSVAEAQKYFSINADRSCKNLSDSSESWYLRTQGNTDSKVAYVNSDGEIDSFGNYEDDELGIRPAMWVNIKK